MFRILMLRKITSLISRKEIIIYRNIDKKDVR